MADQQPAPPSGIPEAVSLELWRQLRFDYAIGGNGLDKEFALFNACVMAVRGYKDIDLSKIT